MNIDIEVGCGLQGRYKLVVRSSATLEIVRETDWFDNLILNAGLDRLGTSSFMEACQVGTSNIAPAVGQTALQGYLAGTTGITSTTDSTQATAPYYGKCVRIFRFGTGVAAGTLAEVGVGWTATTGNLFSRALIADSDGNPTTITVLSDEILDVVYELRMYPDLVDKALAPTISGVTYSSILRAGAVTSTIWSSYILQGFNLAPFGGCGIAYNGALGDITVSPSGTSSAANIAGTLGAYVNGTYFRTVRSDWGLDAGNLVGGISAIQFHTSKGTFKMSFLPTIAKDNTKTLSITMKFSWARYTP